MTVLHSGRVIVAFVMMGSSMLEWRMGTAATAPVGTGSPSPSLGIVQPTDPGARNDRWPRFVPAPSTDGAYPKRRCPDPPGGTWRAEDDLTGDWEVRSPLRTPID